MSKQSKGPKKQPAGFSTKSTLAEKIVGIFSSTAQKTFNYKQISGILNVKDSSQRQLVNRILEELCESKVIEERQKGKYRLTAVQGFVNGKVQMTTLGHAYVITDAIGDDVYVSINNLHHALDGDTVKLRLYAKRLGRMEGEVIEIIERARKTFVGTVSVSKTFAFMTVDSKKMPHDLFIPAAKLKGALNGQKAVARIYEWPEDAKNPFAEIIDVLGDTGLNTTEMHAILAEFELPYSFPEKLDREADKISDKISTSDLKERRDFRGVATFTIDPVDAKDFDDALSMQKIGDDLWEVGVHIADVTHYVRPGDMIDNEAYERATSVYLVDRVVPMIPERLSNYICSLRPDEDKLCFSAVFEMNSKAEISKRWFGRTVIRSKRRFSYEDAQLVIESEQGDFAEEILSLQKLAKILRAKRYKNGSIDFERMEVKFQLDPAGKPLGVKLKEYKDSNKLIEEFMLLANKSVAELFAPAKNSNDKKLFVYRIHDKPNREKLEQIGFLIKRYGYRLDFRSEEKLTESINALIEKVRGTNEQNLIETLLLRAMAKARYSTGNLGHYGLAFQHYTHFTSPIRRFPDMLVHRFLANYLDHKFSKEEDKYEKMCIHASEMEKRAADAERASIKYKQIEFMGDKIGQIFDGVITGVAQYGLFVEIIENKCEGLVPMAEMPDDFFEYDETVFSLIGRRTGIRYQLGDSIKVKVARTNLAKRQMDMTLVEENDEKLSRRGGAERSKG